MKQPLADGLQMHEDSPGRHAGQLHCFSGGAGDRITKNPNSTEQRSAAKVPERLLRL